MTSYVNPFTGQTISPSEVGYEALTISANTPLTWPINGTSTSTTVAAAIMAVTATTTGLQLQMPPAIQVSTGQDALINNVGSNPFTITDASGNTIASVASGAVQYVYVTDNTTYNGTWASFTFGTGTSAANAGSLAGAGLTALGATLNQNYVNTSYYSNATLSTSTRATFALWAGGAGTLTLPAASTASSGWFVVIRNNGSGVVTITPSGSDLIDGNSNKQLQLTESAVFVSTGSGWSTFAYGRSNTFAYTLLSLVVTGGTTTLTSAQAANQLQEYSGTLTSNQVIIVPQTVQLYFITNLCTNGSYTFTVKTSASGGATVIMSSNSSLVLACDGTNVFNAASGSNNTFTNLVLANGSSGAPSLNFTGDNSSGLFLPTTGAVGVAVAGTVGAQFSTTNAYFPYGIQGGQF